MQRYIETVGRVKDGCNLVGVASGLIGSVQCVLRGCLCLRCMPMTEWHGTSL